MWSFEGTSERIEKLSSIIRVLEKAIQSPPSKKYPSIQRKEDKERLSKFKHILNQLKENTQVGADVANLPE